MKIENLKEGMTIKNYPELCEIIEIERKTSNSRKKQFKDLEQYVHYIKEGHSFIIKEIYESSKNRNDGRKSIYKDREIMELLIMDYLIEAEDNHAILTRNQLLLRIHAINENYSYCSANVPSFSKYANIDEQIAYDFFNTTNSNFRSAFDTALKNLRDKALIMYDTVTSIAIAGENHRVATEDEKEMILSIENDVLEELDFEKISQVRMSKKWHLFTSKVKSLLSEKSDISYYYTSFEITINRKSIGESYSKLLQYTINEIERETEQNELNAIVCKRLEDNAIKRKELTAGKMGKYRKKEHYLSDNKQMIELLIDIDSDKELVKKVRVIQEEGWDAEAFLKQMAVEMAEEFGESEKAV